MLCAVQLHAPCMPSLGTKYNILLRHKWVNGMNKRRIPLPIPCIGV